MNHWIGNTRGATRPMIACLGVLVLLPACSGPAKVASVAGATVSATSTALATVGGAVTGVNSTLTGVGGAVAVVATAASVDQQGGETEIDQIQNPGVNIGQQISQGMAYCSAIQVPEYRIDCFADQLAQIVADVPDDPDLQDARGILTDTAAQLAQVATTRASRSLVPAQLNPGPTAPNRSSRDITAVETGQLPQALGEAEQILQQAQLRLLRSGKASERRKVAYQEMANALGRNTLLLRSA